MNVLRTELRRTIAPWLTLAVLVVGLGFFFGFLNKGPWFKEPAAWDGQWASSVLWTRYLLMLLWPIIVGASAIQGMRDSRSGTGELLGTMPRPARHRMTKLSLALGLAAVVAYVVILLTGLGQVVAHDGLFTFSWVLPALVGLVAVIAGVGLGLGVGRLLPNPVTAPALAVLALVACVLLQLSSEQSSVGGLLPNRLTQLGIAPQEPRSPFLVPTVSLSVGQLCWLAGLAATGFLLFSASTVRRRLLALLPVVAGLAIALPLFPSALADNLTVDQVTAAPVCDGPVCVTKMHADQLSTLVRPGKEALRQLAKLPGAPTTLMESTDASRSTARLVGAQDPSKVFVQLDDWKYYSKHGDDAVYRLTAGGGTQVCGAPSYGGERETRELAARSVVSGWLGGGLKLPSAARYYTGLTDLANQAWAGLQALPQQEQLARVAASRQAELSCQGDALTALTRGAA
ncbi:hypothetical protein [Amycolatopsis saalfeldensis]|uniref:ABC-type transport system involved in multi-copper enzyme maturation, permease component n=1 Tax=Amycolatopsis saalfeldensis TaxID=394193 RepID=A0A1H8RJ51_9PSEU|nr:hypothetical protein [Amycolatopsis saalfeldensis]SEO66043.1 hypothetical protein SAMN04489732_101803 [Amycolatopsis saalfeldensis]